MIDLSRCKVKFSATNKKKFFCLMDKFFLIRLSDGMSRRKNLQQRNKAASEDSIFSFQFRKYQRKDSFNFSFGSGNLVGEIFFVKKIKQISVINPCGFHPDQKSFLVRGKQRIQFFKTDSVHTKLLPVYQKLTIFYRNRKTF